MLLNSYESFRTVGICVSSSIKNSADLGDSDR